MPWSARPDGCWAGRTTISTPHWQVRHLTCGCSRSRLEALAAIRLAGKRGNGADAAGRIAIARFFAENVAVNAGGLECTVIEGAESVNAADAALA